MNTELLNKIRKHILARPTRLRMSNWIVDLERIGDDYVLSRSTSIDKKKGKKIIRFAKDATGYNEPDEHPLPECNTIGCIAGWACVLSGFQTRESLSGYGISEKARALLDLTSDKSMKLFYVESWPEPFKGQYLSKSTTTAKQRATIAAKRIAHFIKTNGVDYDKIDDAVSA